MTSNNKSVEERAVNLMDELIIEEEEDCDENPEIEEDVAEDKNCDDNADYKIKTQRINDKADYEDSSDDNNEDDKLVGRRYARKDGDLNLSETSSDDDCSDSGSSRHTSDDDDREYEVPKSGDKKDQDVVVIRLKNDDDEEDMLEKADNEEEKINSSCNNSEKTDSSGDDNSDDEEVEKSNAVQDTRVEMVEKQKEGHSEVSPKEEEKEDGELSDDEDEKEEEIRADMKKLVALVKMLKTVKRRDSESCLSRRNEKTRHQSPQRSVGEGNRKSEIRQEERRRSRSRLRHDGKEQNRDSRTRGSRYDKQDQRQDSRSKSHYKEKEHHRDNRSPLRYNEKECHGDRRSGYCYDKQDPRQDNRSKPRYNEKEQNRCEISPLRRNEKECHEDSRSRLRYEKTEQHRNSRSRLRYNTDSRARRSRSRHNDKERHQGDQRNDSREKEDDSKQCETRKNLEPSIQEMKRNEGVHEHQHHVQSESPVCYQQDYTIANTGLNGKDVEQPKKEYAPRIELFYSHDGKPALLKLPGNEDNMNAEFARAMQFGASRPQENPSALLKSGLVSEKRAESTEKKFGETEKRAVLTSPDVKKIVEESLMTSHVALNRELSSVYPEPAVIQPCDKSIDVVVKTVENIKKHQAFQDKNKEKPMAVKSLDKEFILCLTRGNDSETPKKVAISSKTENVILKTMKPSVNIEKAKDAHISKKVLNIKESNKTCKSVNDVKSNNDEGLTTLKTTKNAAASNNGTDNKTQNETPHENKVVSSAPDAMDVPKEKEGISKVITELEAKEADKSSKACNGFRSVHEVDSEKLRRETSEKNVAYPDCESNEVMRKSATPVRDKVMRTTPKPMLAPKKDEMGERVTFDGDIESCENSSDSDIDSSDDDSLQSSSSEERETDVEEVPAEPKTASPQTNAVLTKNHRMRMQNGTPNSHYIENNLSNPIQTSSPNVKTDKIGNQDNEKYEVQRSAKIQAKPVHSPSARKSNDNQCQKPPVVSDAKEKSATVPVRSKEVEREGPKNTAETLRKQTEKRCLPLSSSSSEEDVSEKLSIPLYPPNRGFRIPKKILPPQVTNSPLKLDRHSEKKTKNSNLKNTVKLNKEKLVVSVETRRIAHSGSSKIPISRNPKSSSIKNLSLLTHTSGPAPVKTNKKISPVKDGYCSGTGTSALLDIASETFGRPSKKEEAHRTMSSRHLSLAPNVTATSHHQVVQKRPSYHHNNDSDSGSQNKRVRNSSLRRSNDTSGTSLGNSSGEQHNNSPVQSQNNPLQLLAKPPLMRGIPQQKDELAVKIRNHRLKFKYEYTKCTIAFPQQEYCNKLQLSKKNNILECFKIASGEYSKQEISKEQIANRIDYLSRDRKWNFLFLAGSEVLESFFDQCHTLLSRLADKLVSNHYRNDGMFYKEVYGFLILLEKTRTEFSMKYQENYIFEQMFNAHFFTSGNLEMNFKSLR